MIYVDLKLNKPRLVQLWSPLDGIHEENRKNLMKIFRTVKNTCMSVAVLQGHVTGEVFNSQPRIIP